MTWLNKLFGKSEPQEPEKLSADTNLPETKSETKKISDFTNLMRRAEWAQPLLQELKEEAELFRRNLAYKSHWPEAEAEGRWFELGMLRLAEEQKAEWDADYNWMIGEDLKIRKMWFEHFVRDYGERGRRDLTKPSYYGESIKIEDIERRESDAEVHERMQEDFDLVIQKTREFVGHQMERAKSDPNLDNLGAYESLERLQKIWSELDKVMDLTRSPPEQYVALKISDEELEPLKKEFFKLHEKTELAYKTLNKIQHVMSEAVNLLDYKIDGNEAAVRDSFDSPFGAAAEFERAQQEKKKNLPQITEHDMAREWGFHVSHVNHANKHYKEILETSWFLGFDHSKLLTQNWKNIRTNTKLPDDMSISEVEREWNPSWSREQSFKESLTARHIDLMERTLEINKRYASEQLDNFFAAIAEEDRIWNKGILEKLTELRKLTAEFKEIGEIDSPSQLR